MNNIPNKNYEKVDSFYYPTPVTNDAASHVLIPPVPNTEVILANVEKGQSDAGISGLQVLPEPAVELDSPNMALLLAALQEMLRDGAMETNAARLGLNSAVRTQRATNYTDAVAALQSAKLGYQGATTEFNERTNQLSLDNDYLSAMTDRLTYAQSQYDAAGATLTARAQELALNPGDQEALNKFNAAQQAHDDASLALNSARSNYDGASATYQLSAAAATEAAQRAVTAQATVTQRLDDLTKLQDGGEPADTTADQLKSVMQIVQECIDRLGDLLDKANDARLNANMKLYREKQDKLIEECKKNAEAYKKAVDEAERKQKKMKLAGKIIGWALTAVSLCAVVVSGGTAAALLPAVIALAIAITDEVRDSKGKEALTSMAMDPVMNLLISGFAKVAKELPGISDEDAEILATILATLTLALAAIVATRTAGAAASKAGAIVDKVANASSSQAIKNALRALNSVADKSLFSAKNSATLMKTGAWMKTGVDVGRVGSSAIQAGMSIESALMMEKALESEADSKENKANLEVLKRITDELIREWKSMVQVKTDMQKMSAELIGQTQSADRFVIRRA
jgi:invasin B